MEILELIAKRRSIRKFTDESIPKELVEKIVQAGREAPTAMNTQELRFTVVRDKSYFEPLAKEVGEAINRSPYHFNKATTLIIVSAPKSSGNAFANAGCAMQNMQLAAASLGVGAYWVNQLKDCSDAPAVRNILTKLQVPEEHVVTSTLALGMPAGEVLGNREQRSEVVWIE